MSDKAHALPDTTIEIPPRTGTALLLHKGDRLTIIDPQGRQVADLLAFNAKDTKEFLSNGRSFDYAGKIYFTAGDALYSNRSNVLLRIVEDTVGVHDFLFTPCSKDTFRIRFSDQEPHHGCFGNFEHALQKFEIGSEAITIPFNCFMNVRVDGETGRISVMAPLTKPGDHIDFVAKMDLVVAVTACSAARSNDGSFKPIHYRINRNEQ